MPNTLNLIADRGMTFNRYYVSYPLCCPSRVSLLTGRYAHSNGIKGNVQPNGGYFGFTFRAAYSHNLAVWLQNAGYRTIHVGKFLNGYGDEPYDNGSGVPPGWSAWHTTLKADTNHYFYGYDLNNNGKIEGPYGDSGSWETREYGVRDDFGCPFAPLNGLPCFYETDMLTNIAAQELRETSLEQPFYLQLDYTAPHGDFRRPAGPEPAPRHYDWFKGAPFPHTREQGLAEGNVADKPSFIREAPYLSLNDHPHLPHLLPEAAGVAARHRRRRETADRHPGRPAPPAQHLHHLHLRQRLLLRRAPADRRQVPRLRAVHAPALPDPRAADPARQRIRRAGGEHRRRPDDPGAGRSAKPTKSIDGRSLVPFLRDPELRTRRPLLFESFVETSDVEADGTISRAGRRSKPASATHGGATASILAPPKDYEGIRLGPYKYIAWPDGEKELYDLEKDPYELNNIVRIPNYFPVRNFLHRELRRLEDCVGRSCREEAGPTCR